MKLANDRDYKFVNCQECGKRFLVPTGTKNPKAFCEVHWKLSLKLLPFRRAA